jgi:colanic acid biosynthesis glycosyl transferase WcaI
MKILLLNQAFYPDVVATAQLASDLTVALAQAGHDVTIVCNSRGYDDPKIRFPKRETWNGVKIIRAGGTGFGKSSRWRRAADFGTFIASCALRLWSLPRFDLVIAMTSPPLISFVASLALPRRARRLVFWSMDLNPDEAIAAGWLRPNSLVARVLSGMLLHSLNRADCIIVLDRFMKERIQAKGISAEKILVVPPWSLDGRIRFDPAGREEFRKNHKLSDKFVVMYSGNHSPCHPLETLLQAAERIADHDDIVFCFIGGGSEFRKVQERARDRGMVNVLCLPYQPIEKLSASLSAADLQVVVMGNEYVGIVHPCKIYNILAADRAFLYIGPSKSHMGDIIKQAGPTAYASQHGDVDGVVTNIFCAKKSAENVPAPTVELMRRFSKELLVSQIVSAIEQSGKPQGNQVADRGASGHSDLGRPL